MRRHGWLVLLFLFPCGCSTVKQTVREGFTEVRREPWIRVGLSTDAPSVDLSSDQEMLLSLREPGQAGHRRSPREVGRELHVTIESGLSLSGGDDYRETLPQGDTMVVDFKSRPMESRFDWNEKHYTGRMLVFRNARSTFTVVNVLPLERYLAGVVPAEIGSAAPGTEEATKAQAVAARTYTLFYLGRRAPEGFDVYGTVEDQVYGGVDAERGATTALIAQSRGRALLAPDGSFVRAMYSSCCGGMCAALDEAFPSPAEPYLIPHRDRSPDQDPDASYCSASASYRWKEEWTMEQFESALARYGPAEWRTEDGQLRGRVLDVRVGARSASGRVGRLDIETTTGTLSLDEMKIRATLRRPVEGGPILRSTLFKVAVDFDGDSPARVVASGAGNGHGVGLCQYGARGMASGGHAYDQILLHYYRGAHLARIFD